MATALAVLATWLCGVAQAETPATPATPAPATDVAQAPASEAKAALALEIPYDRFVLDNGLEVILHEDKRLPVVAVSVWYHVAAMAEVPGKSGFAHLFEHLMFQGSGHVPGDSHFKLLEEAGGSFMNGSTHEDFTNYYEVVPKNELALALWLESDRMGWLMEAVDQKKLDEQRAVVKNERLQSFDNVPYGLADEQLWQRMYAKNHPLYGMIIGSLADLDRASLADVAEFYDRYYAPSNATITLAGDIDKADAKKMIEKYFGSLPKWPKPKVDQVPAAMLNGPVRVDAVDAKAQLALVKFQYFTPAAFAADDADLDILARVLGGNGSRLHQALVVDAPLAQDVSVYNNSYKTGGMFVVSATVKAGVEPAVVENAIQAQLDLLKDLPPSDEELQRAVSAIESEQVFGLELSLQRAETLQRYNHVLGDPGGLARDLARYRAVTAASVVKAAANHLGAGKRGTLVCVPAPAPTASPAKTADTASAPEPQ